MEQEKIVEQPHSVEMRLTKEGNFSGTIKCYAKTLTEAYAGALAKAEELEALIKQKNEG